MTNKNEQFKSSIKEPKSNINLTFYEMELLKGKNPYLDKLYTSLRRLMCFHCGRVGIKWTLNMQYMIDWLTIDADHGQPEEVPTHSNIQRYLRSLEGCDLIEKITLPNQKRGKHYYHLKHAILDKKISCLCKNKINNLLRNCSESVAKPLRNIHTPGDENCGENENYNQLKDKEIIGGYSENCCEISTDLEDAEIESVAKPLRNCSESVATLYKESDNRFSDIQNSPSPASHPPMALTPPIAPSASRKKEKENFQDMIDLAPEIVDHYNLRMARNYSLNEGKAFNCIRSCLMQGFTPEELKVLIDLRVKDCARSEDKYLLEPKQLFNPDHIRDHLAKLATTVVAPKLSSECCYHLHHPDETSESKAQCTKHAPEGQAQLYQTMYGMVVCQWHADVTLAARGDKTAQARVKMLLGTPPEEIGKILGNLEIGDNGIPRLSSIFNRNRAHISEGELLG